MSVVIKTEQPDNSPSPAPNAGSIGSVLRSTLASEMNSSSFISCTSAASNAGGNGLSNTTAGHHTVGPTVSFSLPHIVHSPTSATNGQDDVISDEEAKRRRELLARRPSYRKILNDLSCVELDLQQESDSGGESSEESSSVSNSAIHGSQAGMPTSTLSTVDAISYVASIHTGGLHLPTNVNGDLIGGGLLPPVTGQTLLQYPSLQNVSHGGADLLGLKPLSTAGHHSSLVTQGLMGFSPVGSISSSTPSSSKCMSRGQGSLDGAPVVEEATKKREIRLLKNREAAKECRRKKKEYVKCLENRVTVLEAQNKQLIEELRALKDLYCRKAD